MYITVVNSFIDWFEVELKSRKWSRAELARRSGINQSSLAMIYSGDRKPGTELCTNIARAFNLPPEAVYRAAGLLPPIPDENVKAQELAHLANEMPDTALDDVLEFARHRLELAEKRGEYETKKSKQGK